MTEANSRPPGTRQADGIHVPVLADPAETLARLQAGVREWEAYWARKQEEGGDTPAGHEALLVRRMLQNLLVPRLEELQANKSPHLGLFLNLMVPFDARGGLKDFLLHFFQLGEDAEKNLIYEERNPFERDVYVLYDLYRVKKTLDVVATLQAARQNEERRFPSIFSDVQIEKILGAMPQLLQLMFTQCLPERHREEILPKLSPGFLKSHSLLHRRENDVLYTLPHVLQKYDYRRFFFLIYFKNGLRARMKGEEREFRYNFLHFQVLKHEFLVHWLTGPLRDDPRKYQIYQKYIVQGRSLLEWISNDPAQEEPLLKGMASHTLNDMASQVNDAVPEELKVGMVPESQNFGFYHQLKQNLSEAVDMVRAPIENLRKKVEEEGPPSEEVAATIPAATPKPEPEPPPEPEPVEPKWEITLLKKNQMPRPFFIMESAAHYPAQLTALKMRLGTDWQGFAKYVSALLQRTPEISTVRRRTPKHEWTMPYRLRRIAPEGNQEYLLVLGADVKARPRGMGYQAEEAYNFTPYFVLATDTPDEGFGEPTGQRVAAGRTLQEYSFNNPAVVKKALELFGRLKEKNG